MCKDFRGTRSVFYVDGRLSLIGLNAKLEQLPLKLTRGEIRCET